MEFPAGYEAFFGSDDELEKIEDMQNGNLVAFLKGADGKTRLKFIRVYDSSLGGAVFRVVPEVELDARQMQAYQALARVVEPKLVEAEEKQSRFVDLLKMTDYPEIFRQDLHPNANHLGCTLPEMLSVVHALDDRCDLSNWTICRSGDNLGAMPRSDPI